jgi:hypothetical protein
MDKKAANTAAWLPFPERILIIIYIIFNFGAALVGGYMARYNVLYEVGDVVGWRTGEMRCYIPPLHLFVCKTINLCRRMQAVRLRWEETVFARLGLSV